MLLYLLSAPRDVVRFGGGMVLVNKLLDDFS